MITQRTINFAQALSKLFMCKHEYVSKQFKSKNKEIHLQSHLIFKTKVRLQLQYKTNPLLLLLRSMLLRWYVNEVEEIYSVAVRVINY